MEQQPEAQVENVGAWVTTTVATEKITAISVFMALYLAMNATTFIG
jgi:hypothetical protein